MLLGHGGLLGGVHATNGRAIIVGLVTRTDALQKSNFFGCLAIRWSLHVAISRARSREQAFVLQGSDDIGEAAVAKLFRQLSTIGLVAWRQHDCTDLDLAFLFNHLMDDCIDAASEIAGQAF